MKKVVWRIVDGKAGHENQSLGLLEALQRLLPIDPITVPLSSTSSSWLHFVSGKFPPSRQLPAPDLILAAGSRTHAALLAAGRATGAPTILLMSPARGLGRLFTCCLVPEHDERRGPNFIPTQGALNRIQPSSSLDPQRGLFLVGGPSKHHRWDPSGMVAQIKKILAETPDVSWSLTTSRRTPGETLDLLRALESDHFAVIPFEKTDPDWVPRHLATAAQVRVSEDSVSMVYEALSAGGRVALLAVPRQNHSSKLIHGLDSLVETDRLFDSHSLPLDLRNRPLSPPLQEADRLARILVEKFLS